MAGESVEIDYEDEMLRAKFNEFDLDGDGSITKKELKTVLRSMGSEMPEAEAEAMIHEADKNGDGVISFDGTLYLDFQKIHRYMWHTLSEFFKNSFGFVILEHNLGYIHNQMIQRLYMYQQFLLAA